MNTATESGEKREQRKKLRKGIVRDAHITVLDGEDDCCFNAVVTDISESGATLLSPVPFPLGMRLAINLTGDIGVVGEVVDWQWDYHSNLARTGVRYV